MSNIINIGGTSGGSGSSVIANPQGAATDTLVKLGIEGTIYDFAGGGSATHNYSTTEQVVGTWVDGSTLYEKTVDIGTLPNTTSKQVAHNISDISEIVFVQGYAKNSERTTLPLPYCDTVLSYAVNISVNLTNINITTGRDRSGFSGYITIRYTKSTT